MSHVDHDRHDAPAPPTDLPPVKARQGRLGRPVLIVLIVALLLAMAVWWGVEIFGEQITPPPEQQIGNPSVEPGS